MEDDGERLPLRSKLAYATGVLAHSVGPGTIVAFWYLFFLTDVAGLNPALAAITVLLGGIWDAVNDPLVGWLSDQTRSRWGRRRPYLLFGSVPYGLTFTLMWWVPPIQGQIYLCLYFALVYILFDTAVTVVSCPYDALVPELTLNYDERTSVASYRALFSIVTGLLAAFGFGLLLSSVADMQVAFLLMGSMFGVIFIPTILISFWGTSERDSFQNQASPSLSESLRSVIQNRPWRYSLGMHIFSWVPVNVASAVFVYYLVYWINMESGGASMVQGVILGSSALSLPLVLWIGRRWDKQTAYTASITSWLLVMLSILFVPRGAKLLAITLAVLTGPGIAAAHALPRAMSADTLDVDQIQSGLRQEGIYAGIEVFARKISTKIVLAGIGPVLAWSGYVKNASTQSPQALLAIRLMLGLVPSLILMVAVALAVKYPLNRKLHRQVQLQLSERGLLSKPLTDQKDNYKGGSE